MKTRSFIKLLEDHKGYSLNFEYPAAQGNQLIPPTYHITEIKDHKVTSVDCGGNRHDFDEIVIQLWVNKAEKLRKPWTTDKALSIINIVEETYPLKPYADLYFEFGPLGKERMLFEAGEIRTEGNQLFVRLQHSPAACKPSLAAQANGELSACC